ncbi:hypothetical protein [Parasphingopyxis sp.]|uniref:hypothetical protein n=1 Tax=Parasphingopyxis sp. TaxID=1920299 RepID=UPI00260BD547|nr:hypothetical protein [Parasphingopyxis sp.]
MNKVLARKPPGSFWAISILLLIWNGMGVFAYLAQATADSDQLAQNYPPEEIAIIASMPGWVTGAFAIAVFAGLSGVIALLAKKSWARLMFGISLIAVLAQHFWTFFLSGLLDIVGLDRAIMPIIVVLICIFQIWYANQSTKRGWLR